MPSLTPHGALLHRRLDQLGDSLRDLNSGLHSSVANAVGQSLGTMVRDTVLRVLHSQQESDRWNPHAYRDPSTDDEQSNDRWYDEREREQAYDDPVEGIEPARLTVAVCAALEATSAARRFLGKPTPLTLLGFGLAAGCIAYWTPALAITALGLVRSAGHLSFVRRTLHTLVNK